MSKLNKLQVLMVAEEEARNAKMKFTQLRQAALVMAEAENAEKPDVKEQKKKVDEIRGKIESLNKDMNSLREEINREGLKLHEILEKYLPKDYQL